MSDSDRRRSVLRSALAALALSGVTAGTLAADRFVEDIRVSRTGAQAEIVIELACPMRFQADVPTDSGVLLEIRVSPFDSCLTLGLGAGISSELYRPAGGHLAYLLEVEYESLGLGDSLLMLRFDRAVRYRVSQRGDLRTLQFTIELEESPAWLPSVAPMDRAARPPVETAPAPPGTDRPPLALRVRESGGPADYMVNLQSTRELTEPGVVAGLAVPSGRRLYVSQTTVDGQTWHRLRLGFFASEEEARGALELLGDAFPRAWIGRAEPAEIALASSYRFEPGALVSLTEAPEPDPEAPVEPLADAGVSLSAERVAALMSEARDALLGQDFGRAIQIYTRLLEEPGEHRPEAREFLGLARERNGQEAHARAEYRAYLSEYPESEGARRVQQRLDGLLSASQAPRDPLRSGRSAEGPRWDTATGVSQYYRRDEAQFDSDQDQVVTLSALLSDVDFTMRRSGAKLDMMSRITVNHFHDFIGEEDNGPGDQARISYAYFDVSDSQRDWSMRVGRQSLHNWGILGRFDGAHFTYGWANDQRIRVTTGHPVESTRDGVETDRQFFGVAVDFDDLFLDWDMSAFLSRQTIEGVDDRNAIGTEFHYLDDSRSFTGLLDYDLDFGELNSVLVLGTWRLPNRTTLSALIDSRLSPVLTTRNALIGQPVTTIEEMLLVWTEEEVRRLAEDRTAQARTITLGLAQPISERFQLNADVTATEIEATAESGGVLAVPGTGQQLYYSASIVGSSLFGSGDVGILNLRYGDSDAFQTTLLTLDARFPVGRRLRLNPRLRLAVWEDLSSGRRRETVSPAFRLLMNTRNRYRLEFEVGTDRFTRIDSAGEQDSSSTYVNFGYRADF